MWVDANSFLSDLAARRAEAAAQHDQYVAAMRRMYETARSDKIYAAQKRKQDLDDAIERTLIDA